MWVSVGAAYSVLVLSKTGFQEHQIKTFSSALLALKKSNWTVSSGHPRLPLWKQKNTPEKLLSSGSLLPVCSCHPLPGTKLRCLLWLLGQGLGGRNLTSWILFQCSSKHFIFAASTKHSELTLCQLEPFRMQMFGLSGLCALVWLPSS